jgi:serine/threonine protein kinase/formylglycine-generating enzyme required for sulfatase activity
MTAPTDEPDDDLAQWLEARLASAADGPPAPAGSADGGLSPRRQRLAKCLDALQSLWPSGGAPGLPPAPGWRIPGYEILGAIGCGGMGVVYRGRQLSSGAEVALKALPPAAAADPERLRRCRSEAQIAAQLSRAHVVPVTDVVDTDAGPVLVMPFFDGQDLGRVIDQRRAVRSGKPPDVPHPLAGLPDRAYLDALGPVIDQLMDAVAAVHGDGILHRDIKPANVLLRRKSEIRNPKETRNPKSEKETETHNPKPETAGDPGLGFPISDLASLPSDFGFRNSDFGFEPLLTDFGLARLGDARQLTATGQGLGTAGFMSAEQWAGDVDIDQRADVFGLAATIYQALTLELPFGRSRISPDAPPPTAPSRLQPLLSPGVDAVLLKALEPDRRHRYRTALEFRDDWRRVRTNQAPRARRAGPVRRWARGLRRHGGRAAAVVLVAGLVAAVGVLARHRRGEPPPAAGVPTSLRTVHVTTTPPGARVALVPLDAFNELQPEAAVLPAAGAATPLVLSDVPPGSYLVVAEVPGFGFHEVYRTVPAAGQVPEGVAAHQSWTDREDGSVALLEIRIPPRAVEDGMVRFAGGPFTMGPEADGGPTIRKTVAAFLLDPCEVTVRQYRDGGLALPAAVAERLAASGPESEEFLVTGVSFDEAVACAERLGKRVPLESEYEFAATMGGTRKFPWGDDAPSWPWAIGPVRAVAADRTPTEPPVFGLYSNAAEWADTEYLPYDSRLTRRGADHPPRILLGLRSTRVVRGAPPFVVSGIAPPENADPDAQWRSPRCRQRKSRHTSLPTVGFRGARSATPRWPAPAARPAP